MVVISCRCMFCFVFFQVLLSWLCYFAGGCHDRSFVYLVRFGFVWVFLALISIFGFAFYATIILFLIELVMPNLTNCCYFRDLYLFGSMSSPLFRGLECASFRYEFYQHEYYAA